MSLVEWSRTLGNSKALLDDKYNELELLMSMNNPENLPLIQKVRDEINSLLCKDELFWRQRSRAIWLPAGDNNTKYFHQRASQR